MGPRRSSRSDLVEQWRAIEHELDADDDDDDNDNDDVTPSSPRLHRIQQAKEQWFSAAYNFLVCQGSDVHIWCGFWDVMGPFLETFFNYFKVEDDDALIKILWRKVSKEMRRCTECISRHHQALEMYKAEYESSFISPLLDILQSLDEERVSQHLKEANARLAYGGYYLDYDNAEIVSLMFEILTFPTLLDDESIANEFQKLIEAVDDAHELALAKQQNFPGVYALLFSKSRKSRSIGHRLAGNMEKLRGATDLEPLQPLLKRCIGFLAAEVMPSSSESSRPRVQMERMTVWLGLKALLAFLEPPALEEGILEPYPVLLNFVLDHISDDSPEFSHAVNCMRLFFEILGCKLWLRTSLPPSVMRDSLLSQCFHTRNEKTHKEIFDLFQPLLKSLEALHDGEFEKQRRHLLFFLLHQVTRSSNFSMLMREKACQIALLIVHRGYKMNPPSPPTECAHMWGPSLLSSLKNTALHTSLRQPAIDLIQTIIVSDASALFSSLLHCQASVKANCNSFESIEELDDISSCAVVAEADDVSCWNDFSFQGKSVCQDYAEWLCAPMLWVDVLVDIEPSVLPISVSKAVLWALSRFSMIEPENSSELSLPVKSWLSSGGVEVSAFIGWKFPSGSDDGGDEKASKNSVRVSTMCIPLIKMFRRLAAHFIVQMEQGELRKQWIWEPQMGECLILLLSDPNDNIRQVGRRILDIVSDTRGLASGLQFLCSSGSSLDAILSGLKHALKLVQLDSVLVNFQTLHHFFFALCKIFKEGFLPPSNLLGESSTELNLKFASQGGFLQQTFGSLHFNDGKHLPRVDKKVSENFCTELAGVAWSSLLKCLHEGKAFIDYRISQMTCVRLLELLPIVFGKLSAFPDGSFGKSSRKMQDFSEYSWLCDFMDWGKSSLEAVVRYWKQSLSSLLALLRNSCDDKSGVIIEAIEKMILSDGVPMDSLMEQVSRLSFSLSTKRPCADRSNWKSKSSSDVSAAGRSVSWDAESSPHDDTDVQILETLTITNQKNKNAVIDLSDEETETVLSPTHIIQDDTKAGKVDVLPATSDKAVLRWDVGEKIFESGTAKSLSKADEKRFAPKAAPLSALSHESGVVKQTSMSRSFPKVKGKGIGEKEIKNIGEKEVKHTNLGKLKDKETGEKEMKSKSVPIGCSSSLDEALKTKDSVNARKSLVSDSNDRVLKEVVRDTEDSLELALKSAGRNHSSLTKLGSCLPKRRVIQLADPVDSRSTYLRKLEIAARRFKPPNLDGWFRPILEMDYFAAVGLTTVNEDENKTPSDLKEVPVSFESPQQYVDIFRPLVLEEFKAQLRSSFQEVSSLEEMSCGSLSVVSVERIDDFHLVRCVHEHNSAVSSSCMENDLILLSKQPLKNSPPAVHIVGKVERRERDNKRRLNMLLVRCYLQCGYSRVNRARKLLLERSKWYLSRIMSITPQVREFQALSSIEVIPALPVILRPSYHSHVSKDHRKLDLGNLSGPMQQVLRSSFNGSQIQAISAVVESHDLRNDFDLSLVQGPPGTGKTRTIVALISALLALASQSNPIGKQTSYSMNVKFTPVTSFRKSISESAAIARAWQDAAFARHLNFNMEKDAKLPKASGRKRVLVCAQSNAAVDELVSRLAGGGLYGGDGNMYKPYLVRVGNAKTIHSNSLPFFIDTLVEQRLAEENMTADGEKELNEESSMTLRESLEKIVDRTKFYESKRANLKDGTSDKKDTSEDEQREVGSHKKLPIADLEARLRNLYQQKKEIYTRLAAIQGREKKINEETRALRNKLRRSILREAQIVVTTLSGCGGDLYSACFESTSGFKANISENNLFDAIVIDEAAQALEPASLIPLQLLKSSGTKCIMVGDPKQLPATVLSNVASRYMYECSMFERLQRAGYPVIMLTEQYRMHPEISRFPSLHFYDGKLLNGVQSSSKKAPFHETMGLGPYVFYDVTDGQELYGKNAGSSSLYNEGEADTAIEIVRFLQNRYPSEFLGERIGIITPYKSQLALLRSRFSRAFGSSISSEMEFNTIDGFQGREVDILILSTVRSTETCSAAPRMNSSSIGFVADVRRMNVALTRARLSLWVLGNTRTLQKNSDWAALVKDAKKRNMVITVKRPYKSIFETLDKSSNIKTSGGYCGTISEKVEKSHQVIQSKSIHENYKRKNKHKETRSEHDRSALSEGSRRAKRKSDNTDTYNSISEKHQTMEDSHETKKILKRTRGMDQFESEKFILKKTSDPPGSAGPEKHMQHPKKQENTGSSSHDDGKLLGKGYKDVGKGSNEIEKPKDLISKRKQQREAVDALLSSSLISAKKSEKVVPHKRTQSQSSTACGGPKPTKQQKGLNSLSCCSIRERV